MAGGRLLKVGIDDELVARGVLGAREVDAALKQYVDRFKYQKCLAAGGARFDLEGKVAGEVPRNGGAESSAG
jgi:sRNA-binding protein